MAFLAPLIHIKSRDGVLNNCWKEGEGRWRGREGRKGRNKEKNRKKGKRDKRRKERKKERKESYQFLWAKRVKYVLSQTGERSSVVILYPLPDVSNP